MIHVRDVLFATSLLATTACVGTLSEETASERNSSSGKQDDASNASGDAAVIPADPIAGQTLMECEERNLSPTPLRRLSSAHYEATLVHLFGAKLATPLLSDSQFPPTHIDSGFSTDAEANRVNATESQAIEDNAARIAGVIDADPEPYLEALLPCELPSPATDSAIDECLDDFISAFGKKAYRRPLSDDEAALARRVYSEVREDNTAAFAFSAVVQFFVESPALLYRVERGAEVVRPGMVRLTDWEMATRLSFLLSGGPPDAELRERAEAGDLQEPADVVSEARRLLDSPGFVSVFAGFHRDWLHLYELEETPKDPATFPEFTEEVQAALTDEMRYVGERFAATPGMTLPELLAGARFPVASALASLYGVEEPADDDAPWREMELAHRRGLLTSASLMAALATATRTSPIHRGAFVQTQILCNSLPALPGNVDIQGPLQDTSMLPTARERLSPLLSRGECAGCHVRINPIGLSFENYDALGRWRDRENDEPIDGSGSIDLGDGPSEFGTPMELAEVLASHQQTQACYATQWYRATTGRPEFADDACGLAFVKNALAESDGDIRELLLALVQTDAFLYRSEVTE